MSLLITVTPSVILRICVLQQHIYIHTMAPSCFFNITGDHWGLNQRQNVRLLTYQTQAWSTNHHNHPASLRFAKGLIQILLNLPSIHASRFAGNKRPPKHPNSYHLTSPESDSKFTKIRFLEAFSVPRLGFLGDDFPLRLSAFSWRNSPFHDFHSTTTLRLPGSSEFQHVQNPKMIQLCLIHLSASISELSESWFSKHLQQKAETAAQAHDMNRRICILRPENTLRLFTPNANPPGPEGPSGNPTRKATVW